ncbi:MAG: polysaccharide biosynthesis protein [Pseudomonadota bacterium]
MALTTSYDVAMAAVAMYLAVEVRWRIFGDFAVRPFPDHVPITAAVVFAFSAMVGLLVLRVHKQVWRHAGWPDAVRVIQAAGLAALIFLPIMFLWNRLGGFPRASLLLAVPFWMALLLLGRMIALSRSTNRPLQIFRPGAKDAPRALLVGDTVALADALREIERDPKGAQIRVLGLIDTANTMPGRAIRGITVHGGLSDLPSRLDMFEARYGAYPWVATVGEGRSRDSMRLILDATSTRGSEIMSLGGGEEGARLVPVRPADLLGRKERPRRTEAISDLISGASLFVTGGGGTIGAELVRQCAALKPSRITIYDSSEYNLYRIDQELQAQFPEIVSVAVLGDVRDGARLARSMREAQPDVVIHAAALKHVPLMEMNPCEAILTNAGGAANAAKAAVGCQAKRFVFISTDKAVDPDNVMGATKRLAEMMVRQAIEGTETAAALVRFGNVLGSSGSVVPLFDRQIAEGGPVTVTHPEITRYFMTIEEAGYLVLQAATQQPVAGEAGLFVLDMGEPVKIQSLAESMIRMKGLVPGVQIRIVHTGLRPGDKMYERLTYDHEALTKTAVEGVNRVNGEPALSQGLPLAFESLLKTASERDPEEALSQLETLVEAYTARPITAAPTGTG